MKRASGARGQYQANKELRLSEEFEWPPSPQAVSASPNASQMTSSGRAFGTSQYSDFECPAPKKIQPTEQHFIQKLSALRAELRASNQEKAEIMAKLEEKEGKIRSLAKRIVDLERRVGELGILSYKDLL